MGPCRPLWRWEYGLRVEGSYPQFCGVPITSSIQINGNETCYTPFDRASAEVSERSSDVLYSAQLRVDDRRTMGSSMRFSDMLLE